MGWTKRALAFGHNWVVLAMVVRVPLIGRPVAVPVLWRLYRSKKKRVGRNGRNASGGFEVKTSGEATDENYRTRPELVVEMTQVLRQALGEDRPLRLVGDSAYGGKSVSTNLPEATHLVSRLPRNAGLYETPPPRAVGGRGRPRKKGAALPSPGQMAQASGGWVPRTAVLYGMEVTVLVKTVDALWYGSCKTRLLRVVVTRDPSGERKDDYLFTTDLSLTPVAILEIYARRWSLEVAFRDMKQELGLERPQSRTRQAVERTVPFIAAVHGLVVAWFARSGHFRYPGLFPIAGWYRQKEAPSFADMLRTFRYELLISHFVTPPDDMQTAEKLRKSLKELLLRAA